MVEKARDYTLAVTGCIICSSKRPQMNILKEVIASEGGNPRNSVVSHRFKTSIMNAALINGVSGHTLYFDDDYREGALHSSVAVFPAVFAIGECNRVGGKDFLLSFKLGLEVMIHLGESVLGKSYYQEFHPTGICGLFGAAASCANVMGLDTLRTKYAIGISGSVSRLAGVS